MVMDPGAIEKALAAAVGDDDALIAELKSAFLESAQLHLASLYEADDRQRWQDACWRLHALAVGFGVMRLAQASEQAASLPPRDRLALRRLRTIVHGLSRR